jgi:Mrp family chromosome partitioning ATPase
MKSGGAEALKAAIRRSLLMILLLVLLGVVAVNAFKQLRGPRYSASARVLISTTSLTQILTQTVPPFVDPNRIENTARALAGSPSVFDEAARRTGNTYGTAGDLAAASSVSGGTNDDILTFTASSDDSRKAVGIANAVANGYVVFRSELNASTIEKTAGALRAKLKDLPPGNPARTDIQKLLNTLDALSTASSGDAKVVQTASSATKTTPAPVKDSLLGFSIGLVIALLVVAVREAIDTTVRSESDVEDLLSVPVLATVRSLPRRTRIVTYGRHEAAYADTYALLAANVARGRVKSTGEVLAVTSAVSREGKTTTAANLAVSLARRGMNVILCDFDFRKPALGDLFHIPAESPGALQVLEGSATLEDSLWSVTLSGPRPRISQNGAVRLHEAAPSTNGESATAGSLSVLASGGTVGGWITHGEQLPQLLKDLRKQADFAIVDTPPALLTVEMAELSQLIDDVLVVVRQGRVTERNLRSLNRQVQTWSAEVAGVVLTDAPATVEQYAYGVR